LCRVGRMRRFGDHRIDLYNTNRLIPSCYRQKSLPDFCLFFAVPDWSEACLYGGTNGSSSLRGPLVSSRPPLLLHLTVLPGVLSRITNANDLKDALDLSAQRTRAIAGRVAQASVKNGSGFALPVDPATGKPAEGDDVDLEAEMTSLADEQVRFEATEKLLEKTYAQLRTAIKDK
jgi:hypothetical protein